VIHIEQFEVFGYQHLCAAYGFSSGLNVVTGANESGKSTLHEALTAGVFGFSCEDRRRRGGVSPKELRRPWSGAPFGAVLTVVDRDSRRLRLHWDFESDLVEVSDCSTGELILREQPQQRTDYSLGDRLLGVSREDHAQLSCLFQVGLEPVRPSESLRQSLQRAVEASAGDGGVETADACLRALLSRLGVHAGHYGATASGRLARTDTAVRALHTRLERAKEDRRALEELARDRVRLERQLADVDGQILAHRQAALRDEAARLEADHAAALRLTAAAPAPEAAAAPALPPDLSGRVAAARDRLRESDQLLDDAREAAAAAASELAVACEAARRADAERDGLTAYADVDTSNEEAVRTELGRLRAAAPSLTPPEAPPARDREQRETGASRARLVVAAILALAGIAAGVSVHPAAFALVLVAAAAGWAARPTLARASDAEERERLRHEAAVAEHERIVAQSAGARAAAETALHGLLGAGPVEARAEDYLRECATHRRYADADRRAEAAAVRARTASAPAEALRGAEQGRLNAEQDLRRLLARAGIEHDDLAVALETFDGAVAAEVTRREEAESRADAAGRLEQLLEGRSLEELAATAAQTRAAYEDHVSEHGERPGGEPGRAAGEAALAVREQVVESLAGLRARVEEREASMEAPAELELHLEQASSERARLKRYRDAARLARDELAAAAREAHQRVAPHLNAALARELPRVTRGRYREAMVADDLAIRVVVPGSGKVVDVERLSRGTRDQIALVERLELARLLDPTGGGAPLLLDDCFSHTDEHRLPLALELLAEVAEHRQVIVFTGDRGVVDAVRAVDGTAAVIELPDPAAVPIFRAA
jgi:DNA repair exonuclease SbcCD ATPase subunit